MVSAMMPMLGLSMLQATLNGSRVVNYQGDEFRLTSAVESAAIHTAENVWSAYLRDPIQSGAAGDIESFRDYLDAQGVIDMGPGGSPGALDGTDVLQLTGVPGAAIGNPELDDVNVDTMRILRRDEADATQLFITVSASTNRGQGIINPVLNRAIQLVYTIEPDTFEGFDYGILTNNVNCIFCHTVVDNAERFYNTDPAHNGSFDRVRVGSLEALHLRDNVDGNPATNDWDADSLLAGTLYIRGSALDQNGVPIANWGSQSLVSADFDVHGHLNQDSWGALSSDAFTPAGSPPPTGENLYLDYPTAYADMPDGKLPTHFPPPFPDDGGIDPFTGLATTAGENNRIVDPEEFFAASQHAEGAITAGIINMSDPAFVIDTVSEYSDALFTGNQVSLASVNTGNVILSGTASNPIAIDGDLVINGFIKGKGTLMVSGNIYVPTDLKYLDGQTMVSDSPTCPRTFGIAQDGTSNALGLVSGSNILLGDYLKPSVFTGPGTWDITDGSASDDFNFVLSEISIFNRNEWAKTLEFFPGPGQIETDPTTWTIPNPNFDLAYIPRYYQFGDGNEIPIYNKGDMYWDTTNGAWHTSREAVVAWDTAALTIVDPADTTNPYLYDGLGNAYRSSKRPPSLPSFNSGEGVVAMHDNENDPLKSASETAFAAIDYLDDDLRAPVQEHGGQQLARGCCIELEEAEGRSGRGNDSRHRVRSCRRDDVRFRRREALQEHRPATCARRRRDRPRDLQREGSVES
jgi:hypothetical protein